MVQQRRSLLPRYAWGPLTAVFIFSLAVYNGTKWITAGWTHHTLALPIDGAIPFWPAFISIYILAYLQWCIGYIMAARDSRDLCGQLAAGDLAAKLICLVFFLALPTVMSRPALSGSGFWETLTGLIYRYDTPVNLFPSIHCLESWMCLRGAMLSKKAGPWYKAVMAAFTVLVCASTVLVKQHVVLDVAGGILVAELGLLLARKFCLGRCFAWRPHRFTKKTG